MDGHGRMVVGTGFGYGVDNDTGIRGPTGQWGSLGSVGLHRVYVVKVPLRTLVDLMRLQALGVGMRNSITVGTCSLIGRSLCSWICDLSFPTISVSSHPNMNICVAYTVKKL